MSDSNNVALSRNHGQSTSPLWGAAINRRWFAYIDADAQFCMQKGKSKGKGDGKENAAQFAFVDLTGEYGDPDLRSQLTPEKLLKLKMRERFPRLMQLLTKTRNSLLR